MSEQNEKQYYSKQDLLALSPQHLRHLQRQGRLSFTDVVDIELAKMQQRSGGADHYVPSIEQKTDDWDNLNPE